MLYPPPPTTLFQASHYSKAMLLGCSTSCWNVVAALAAVAAAALLLRRRNGRRRLLELQEGFRFRGRDVVVLHMMGRSTTSPNASPFPIKLETYLRAMDIKYVLLLLKSNSAKRFTGPVNPTCFCPFHYKKPPGQTHIFGKLGPP